MGRNFTLVFVLTSSLCAIACSGRTLPPGECTLTIDHTQTVRGLGSAQGLFVNHGFVYFLGDTEPSIALEYLVRDDDELVPTGRAVRLTHDGASLGHPQGLTSRDGVGTFLGDTMGRRGVIYELDWAHALDRGELAPAVIERAHDAQERYGLHPELVRVDGHWLLATATYGPTLAGDNQIELVDPRRLAKSGLVHDDVVRARFSCESCGTFIQSLTYDEANDLLVLVQNDTKWRGWRLTFVDVARSVAEGDAHVAARLDAHGDRRFESELEGYGVLDDGRAVFLSNRPRDNVHIGRVDCDVALRDR
jgi:hypothetical protein